MLASFSIVPGRGHHPPGWQMKYEDGNRANDMEMDEIYLPVAHGMWGPRGVYGACGAKPYAVGAYI